VTDEARIEVVKNAVRWASNMLVEVNSNHAEELPADVSEKIRVAVRSLADIKWVKLTIRIKGQPASQCGQHGSDGCLSEYVDNHLSALLSVTLSAILRRSGISLLPSIKESTYCKRLPVTRNTNGLPSASR